jgi:hypothetical protein
MDSSNLFEQTHSIALLKTWKAITSHVDQDLARSSSAIPISSSESSPLLEPELLWSFLKAVAAGRLTSALGVMDLSMVALGG